MSATREVPARLPDTALPDADWADAFEIELPDRRLSAMEASRMTLGRVPGWARRLLTLRNALAKLVGLKTDAGRESGKTAIGMFPVVSETPERVVLGFDDWHLDFRIVVEVTEAGGAGMRLRTTTLVRRKNLFGRLYIGLVTPFHRLIVPATLRGAL